MASSIPSLLDQVNDVKLAIKAKLIALGVNMSNVPFTQYADKIPDPSDLASGNAVAGDVRLGKTFSNSQATGLVGTWDGSLDDGTID